MDGARLTLRNFSVLTTAVCALYVPETLGKSLSEVDALWDLQVSKTKLLILRWRSAQPVDDSQSEGKPGEQFVS